jgi:D-sedoheptulose 7-phosphate isomerase
LTALALSTDSSALTCIANDYNFDDVFYRQVVGLGKAGDCLVAISTSGNSRNVIRAAEAARSADIRVIGLLGRDGGALRDAVPRRVDRALRSGAEKAPVCHTP